ncbi:carboxypeptidase-like regulatory domain-containing protein [Paraflavitalea speifideaquila]|uniref:carboxypeptidase-like regulatory domain-containing protein n=1 Tax=Paraflavitalea speifideaquila TaxID=3076558 RepID=UPI0028ECB45F|nr:carboxypeptidase-like regulatory domain-containing protein [Paraflavitalea speifideiaquila]
MRNTFTIACFAGLLLIVTLSGMAQGSNRITGIVVNATNGTPIASASVFISNTSSGTMSNAAGHFSLTDIPKKVLTSSSYLL